MLKKETIQKIAAALKLKEADLQTAISAEAEVDFDVPAVTTFSDGELTQLKNNEYKSGKEKGIEMAVKEVKEEMKLDFQGKTLDGLIKASNKKAVEDAGLTPDKKVTELTEKVTTLQNTVKEYETKLSDKDSEVTGVKINGELFKHIPAPGEDGPAIGADDVIAMMNRSGYEFKLIDGKVVAHKDGKAIQDKLSENLPVKDVITSFMTEKKLISEEKAMGGRGGGDRKPPAKAGKLSELKAQYTTQGKSLLGSEFSSAVAQAAKDNKDFDMNS